MASKGGGLAMEKIMFDWQFDELEEFCSDPVKDIEFEMNATCGICDPDALAIPYEIGCCG